MDATVVTDTTEVRVCAVVDPWARMPLAVGVLSVWRFVFDEGRLSRLWDEHRGACYQKVISFPTMVHLVAEALLQYGGSGRRSFEKNIEAGQLNASVVAAFGKLGRLPLALSEAFLREGTRAIQELFPSETKRPLPASLAAFDVHILDGKALKNVSKRLKPLRGVGGGLLGGKALVALDWSTGLALAMHAHADGDASEKRLVKDLLTQTVPSSVRPILFLSDRGFCDLVQAALFVARQGDHFVVRHHAGTTFTPDANRAATTGVDSEGRTVHASWGWLGSQSNKGRRYVRRLHLVRPGQEDIVVMTSLLDEEAYPAADLLWLYRERWGIERMFQKVTEVFGLEQLIGGTPHACVFQLAFCMLLYNLIQLLTSTVAVVHECDAEDLSNEKLFDDVHRELIAWNVVFTPRQTIDQFADCPSADDLKGRLRGILAKAWSETWWKAPKQKDRPPSKRQAKRGHGSVYRILQDHDSTAPNVKKRC